MSEQVAISVHSQEHLAFLMQKKKYRLRVICTQIFLFLFFVTCWELAARLNWIDPFITSQPSRIIRTLLALHREGVLFGHIRITVMETVAGFTLGTLAGTVIAVILWWSDFLAEVLDPYLVILNSLPKIAFGPILIVWLGQGMRAIIAMALFVSLVVTILSVYSGFRQVEENKIKLLKSFGATKKQILQLVILPSSIPTIISALKINVGLSWVGVIVGEFLVSRAGLGYLIVYGGQVFRLDIVMASVIILSVAAAVMYQLVVVLEKIAVRRK